MTDETPKPTCPKTDCEKHGYEFKSEHQLKLHILSSHPEVIDMSKLKDSKLDDGDAKVRHVDEIAGIPPGWTTKKHTKTGNTEETGEEQGTTSEEYVVQEIPDEVHLALTYKNRVYNRASPYYDMRDQDNELSAGSWFKIIDKLKDVNRAVITGGEPVEHSEFYDILDYAANTFNEVVVETEGVTQTDFGRYDCKVSVRMEYPTPGRNNQLRRKTDPSLFQYDPDQGIKNPDGLVYCMMCSNPLPQSDMEAHLKENHKQEVLSMADAASMEQMDMGKLLQTVFQPPNENVHTLTLRKLANIPNDKEIKAHIYNDNDVAGIILLAEQMDADTCFVPSPGYKERGIQTVRSSQLKDAIETIQTLNKVRPRNHRIDWEYPHVYDLPKWPKRGKNRMFVTPQGKVTPSPYMPHKEIADILKDSNTSVFNTFNMWTGE